MFSTADTIVAIATPPGRGGIGVVRLSGPEARSVACRLISRGRALEPRRATWTKIRLAPDDGDLVDRERGAPVDEALVTFFPAPRSYTGQDMVELSAHGSPVVLSQVVRAAVANGARLAERGEFTLRAFLNGRLDLPQAEAVRDLIDAVTPLQARAAFDQLQGTLTDVIGGIDAALFDLIARLEASIDFPDEGYHFIETSELQDRIEALARRTSALLAEARRGRLVREGLQVAIVGTPNVGKSSLFNALVGTARAIVTDVPGTTRDLVTETVDLEGLQVTLVDTAGLCDTEDIVEAEGVARSKRALSTADLTIVVLDRSRRLAAADRQLVLQTIELKRVIVENKADLPAAWSDPGLGEAVSVSATTGAGLDTLRQKILTALEVDPFAEGPSITNIRHIALVERAHEALTRAGAAVSAGGGQLPEEFVLADLQEARGRLEEITGRRTNDELLSHIFSRFCVGK